MAVKQAEGVRRRLWTRKEFYQLLDLGFFQGQRVELIEGVIVQMPAQKNYHALSVTLSHDALRVAFGAGYWVRVQMSLDLTPFSVPDPDLAVVRGNPRDHNTPDNPTTALLIMEVSETTLRYDRRHKGGLYARVAIEDYWIVNLVDRHLEVYRTPIPDTAHPYRFRYADVNILSPADYATPLAAPQARILVADLLP
jgi:Uma2 family endonuclease